MNSEKLNKITKRIVGGVLAVALVFISYSFPAPPYAQASTTNTYTASTSWTAPTGVTSVTAEVWGGGGGGGGQNLASDGGGGGGGGAYSLQTVTVVAGNSYTVTVGALGSGGNKGCGGTGGDSWFSTTGTVLAKGGVGGCNSTGTPPAGGLGGAAASGVGSTKFSGGQGEVGKNNSTGVGGYGGSSAGTAANGWSGPQTFSTNTYPTASTPTGAGYGGNGGAASTAGSAPASGNGGGGGGSGETTTLLGGAGKVGKVVLTYNRPPNVPTQNSPTNSATGVSVTPTFLMTATDADTTVIDNLSYKVTIYSNSGCSTVVQTDDQAVSSTGWTGSDATCTASPTACYLSGTQGSFLTQTSLAGSTQYWWRASAMDPDGSGTFTDSSTCNTFTTGTAVSAPTVTTNFAGGINFNSANLVGSITATGGANATQNGFAYGTVSNLSTVIATTTLGGMTGTGPFNSGISGLSTGVTYYYRAYATNTGGTGYGSILNFTTGDSTPSRMMRLFEGFIIKLFTGKLILFGS